MISLQRSMHSSQMYTPGPAISFLTCFWLLPQKEHFSRSPPSPIRATQLLLCPGPPPAAAAPACGGRPAQSDTAVDLDGTASAPVVVAYGPVSAACGERLQSIRLGRPYLGLALEGRQNLIYQPVLLGFFGREELVPLDVAADLILFLAGVQGDDPLHRGPHPEDLPGLNLQV